MSLDTAVDEIVRLSEELQRAYKERDEARERADEWKNAATRILVYSGHDDKCPRRLLGRNSLPTFRCECGYQDARENYENLLMRSLP